MIHIRNWPDVDLPTADHLSLSRGRQLRGDGDSAVEVREAIAIIINEVPAATQMRQVFRRRRTGCASLGRPVDAVANGALAGADPTRGRTEAIVSHPVAIVVDAVASFGAGGTGGASLGRPVDAVVDGALAGAEASCGGAEVVVDAAV